MNGAIVTPCRRAAAFSLIELTVALAIVAVLVAYAMPSYREHVARAHRADAVMGLYRAAQYLEANPGERTRSPGVLPAGLDQVPPIGVAVYRLYVADGDRNNGGYAVEARPVDTGPMADDRCGTFVLDAIGQRANRLAGSRDSPDSACWLAR